MRTAYYESFLGIDLQAESSRLHDLVSAVNAKVQLASDEASNDPDSWSIHVLPFIPIINT